MAQPEPGAPVIGPPLPVSGRIQPRGPRPDRPRETEEAPGRQPGPPEPDEPKRDQPGPISPEPDYLPEGPRDPLPGSGQPSPRRSSGHRVHRLTASLQVSDH